MYRTTLNDLAWCLENLDSIPTITIPDDVMKNARVALSRMLDIQG
jgi:quinolinate synthase